MIEYKVLNENKLQKGYQKCSKDCCFKDHTLIITPLKFKQQSLCVKGQGLNYFEYATVVPFLPNIILYLSILNIGETYIYKIYVFINLKNLNISHLPSINFHIIYYTITNSSAKLQQNTPVSHQPYQLSHLHRLHLLYHRRVFNEKMKLLVVIKFSNSYIY